MHDGKEIVRLLDVEDRGNDCFVGHPASDSTLDKVYGGQLFGQALAAAQRTVAPAREAHSVQALCLGAGNHGVPIEFSVERLRDGRSFSARSVVATQDGRSIMRLTASFQTPEPGLEHAATMPDVPPPDELPTVQDVIRDFSELPDEPWHREWEGLDLRYVVTPQLGQRSAAPSSQRIWIRVTDRLPDHAALHRQVTTYLSDMMLINAALIPHGLVMGAPELPRATLNHSVWLHADARADEWLLIDQSSPWAGGARGISLAQVFSADGRHVASLAQEGLMRPRGELRRRLGIA